MSQLPGRPVAHLFPRLHRGRYPFGRSGLAGRPAGCAGVRFVTGLAVVCGRGAVARLGLLAGVGAATFHLGLEPWPARETVIPGDGELGRGQGDLPGNLAEPAHRAGVAANGGTVQLAGLTAELIDVWAAG